MQGELDTTGCTMALPGSILGGVAVFQGWKERANDHGGLPPTGRVGMVREARQGVAFQGGGKSPATAE